MLPSKVKRSAGDYETGPDTRVSLRTDSPMKTGRKRRVITVCKSRSRIMPVLLAGLVFWFSGTSAAQNQITVQFLARGMEPRNSEMAKGDVHDDSVGHAFMIITIHTNQGPREEVYGFYPREGGKGVIKGPGLLRSEFRCGQNDDCNPVHNNLLKRFSEVKESVTIPISIDQRRLILQEVNKWDSGKQGYNLLTQNCVDFVDTVAKDLGFATPSRTQTPTQYLSALRNNVKQELDRQENVRREAQRQEEARREAAELERQREEAEAEAEAKRIPPGWVPCSCPKQHAPYGKFVNGTLYHPNNVSCH